MKTVSQAMKRRAACVILVVASSVGVSGAGEVTGLTTFTSGTKAKASEVNGNFSAVKSAVDGNHSDIGTNAAHITTNTANIATNTADVATNAADIDALEGEFEVGGQVAELQAQLAAALAALNASVTCPANTAERFTDLGDGTVCDSETGLMWEIKLADTDPACTDADQANRDVRCVNNTYTWTDTGDGDNTNPDGTLYTDFLRNMNDLIDANDGTTTTCFAGHCDWRVPTIGELRSIVRAPHPFCLNNIISPCIAEGFPGPTQGIDHWSYSAIASVPDGAWSVSFVNGFVFNGGKDSTLHVRAVRGGR